MVRGLYLWRVKSGEWREQVESGRWKVKKDEVGRMKDEK
jgi:hypothetical protein